MIFLFDKASKNSDKYVSTSQNYYFTFLSLHVSYSTASHSHHFTAFKKYLYAPHALPLRASVRQLVCGRESGAYVPQVCGGLTHNIVFT